MGLWTTSVKPLPGASPGAPPIFSEQRELTIGEYAVRLEFVYKVFLLPPPSISNKASLQMVSMYYFLPGSRCFSNLRGLYLHHPYKYFFHIP